jgi:hypothetical protein
VVGNVAHKVRRGRFLFETDLAGGCCPSDPPEQWALSDSPERDGLADRKRGSRIAGSGDCLYSLTQHARTVA